MKILKTVSSQPEHRGKTAFWLIACAASHGHPAALEMLIQSGAWAKLTPQQLLELLKAAPDNQDDRDLGKTAFWVITCAASNGHPAALETLIQSGAWAKLTPQQLPELFKAAPAHPDDTALGETAFWTITMAAANGYPAPLEMLMQSNAWKNLPVDDILQLLKSFLTHDECSYKDIPSFCVIIIAAANYPKSLNLLTQKLMQLPRRRLSNWLTTDLSGSSDKLATQILKVAVNSNRMQPFEWLLCCVDMDHSDQEKEAEYQQKVLPILKKVHSLTESILSPIALDYPVGKEEKNEEEDTGLLEPISKNELDSIVNDLISYESDPSKPKENLLSIILDKLQTYTSLFDLTCVLNKLTETFPESEPLKRQYVDLLILQASSLTYYSEDTFLSTTFKNLISLNFLENDELLWQRLIIKVIESDSNKKIFHPSDGQIAGFIKETFTLKEQRKITFEDFKNACTQFKEKLTTEPEQKEKPLYNSQFFRTPVAVTVAESESDHDYHTRI
ncbi:ankyrin repeat domain-containing protein [Coxiella burnetii]|uniref:ankyrin repeat domain-containing protein n=1 Tax=Coxiella burnetii TaxID=777 RepID=UPI00217688FD|nr:ankyrin repeat domain-containing protein [Coxiella burnetii]